MSTSVLNFATIASIFIYAFLFDWRFYYIWWTIMGIYTLAHYSIKDGSASLKRLKVRLATWSAPTDSNVYIKLEIPMTNANAYIENYNKNISRDQPRLTMTHIALKSIANGMWGVPGACGKIIFGKYVPADNVSINTLIDLDGSDLAQITVSNVEKMTLTAIAEKINHVIRAIKGKKNTEHEERTKGFDIIPDWVLNIVFPIVAFLSYNLAIPCPPLKMKANGMGNFLFTNVTKLGYKEAFAPLCNFTRNVVTVVLCEPYWAMQFDEDGSNPRTVQFQNVMMTCDHRYLDGAGGASIMRNMKDTFINPGKYNDDSSFVVESESKRLMCEEK